MNRITLTPKEAANILGISYWLILELAKRNEIPHIRVGKKVLFREASILEWLEEQESQSSKKKDPCTNSPNPIRRLQP